jgi:serine/threonine protein kinase
MSIAVSGDPVSGVAENLRAARAAVPECPCRRPGALRLRRVTSGALRAALRHLGALAEPCRAGVPDAHRLDRAARRRDLFARACERGFRAGAGEDRFRFARRCATMRETPVASKDENKNPELFGPYEVYERLGVGGMATVHRAKKQGIEGFERVVALKRMLSHLADDETFIQSFVREARLASQLQHGNIIHIYDLGRVGRVYYIAMEYIRGRDLRKILKQTAYATGPMPLAMMLMLARQLCDALDYAHGLADETGEPLGLVHRDVSPSNILIAADGHLKIIDFGIAKATSSSLRTLSGRVKGKFAYMAPEAIHGKQLDRRTDIFAVGTVAHEMLTARPLFATKNQFDTIRRITQEEVKPPSHYNPECPPELDEIIMTALAKSPDERWQTAGAMHRALDHVAKKHGLQTTNREIAEWLEWAFQQPLQQKRVELTHRTDVDVVKANEPAVKEPTVKEPTLKSGPVVPVENLDSASIELVWGGRVGGRSRRDSGGPGELVDAPYAVDDRGSQPVPVQSLAEAGSGAVHSFPLHAGARDGSQPYRMPTPVPPIPIGPAVSEGSRPVSRPIDAREAAGQSTMLGVAPPPLRHSTKPTSAPQPVFGPPGTTGSGPVSTPSLPPPQRTTPHMRNAPERPRPQPPQGQSSARTLVQILLVLALCVGAAVGGYFIVLAVFGN